MVIGVSPAPPRTEPWGVVNACLTRVISSGHARNYERMARPKILPSGPDIAAPEVPSSLFHSSSPSAPCVYAEFTLVPRVILGFPFIPAFPLPPPSPPPIRYRNQRDTPLLVARPANFITTSRRAAGQDTSQPPENGKRTRPCAPILSLSCVLPKPCASE